MSHIFFSQKSNNEIWLFFIIYHAFWRSSFSSFILDNFALNKLYKMHQIYLCNRLTVNIIWIFVSLHQYTVSQSHYPFIWKNKTLYKKQKRLYESKLIYFISRQASTNTYTSVSIKMWKKIFQWYHKPLSNKNGRVFPEYMMHFFFFFTTFTRVQGQFCVALPGQDFCAWSCRNFTQLPEFMSCGHSSNRIVLLTCQVKQAKQTFRWHIKLL